MRGVLPAPPPIARRVPKVDVVHGDIRHDDYHWFRQKDDPEVTAYLTAENAYTDAVMKPSAAFRERLYSEMLARIKEDDQTVPYRRGGVFYSSPPQTRKQYPNPFRQAGGPAGPAPVMPGPNPEAGGHPFLRPGAAPVGDDGRAPWPRSEKGWASRGEAPLGGRNMLSFSVWRRSGAGAPSRRR